MTRWQHDTSRPRPPRYRTAGFAVLAVVCVLVAGGYSLRAAQRRTSGAEVAAVPSNVTLRPAEPVASAAAAAVSPPATAQKQFSAAPARPAATRAPAAAPVILTPPLLLAVQSGGTVSSRRQAAVLELDDMEGAAQTVGLSCERVYYAAGQGLCLTYGADPSSQSKVLFFGADFRVQHSLTTAGIPSRARVSPDGRYGAITSFILGDSYAANAFSTRTTIFDMGTGTAIVDLEDFTVSRDRSVIQAEDFNFWGVTFARDSNTFYATLATGGKTFLIEGDLAARTARTLAENVECPSLSPDNQHIAFKRRLVDGPRPQWRPYVLDVSTLATRPLGETRNVDDQIEWLDDSHVLYALGSNTPGVWEAGINGDAAPLLFADNMLSPSVIR